MRELRTRLCVIILLLLCCAAGGIRDSKADALHPYRAQLSLRGVEFALRPPRQSSEYETIPSVRVQGRVYAAGNIDVRLGRRRNKTWSSAITRNGVQAEDRVVPVILNGRISLGGGIRPKGRRVMPAAAYKIGRAHV